MKQQFCAELAPDARAGQARRILLEAGAGTGKTFNLTALVLWYMLLDKLLPAQILCVTFTRAATAELRLRISARLEELLVLGRSKAAGESPQVGDPVLQALLEHLDEAALAHLERCQQQFAHAAIFTIDSFCQRLLTEHALSSGSSFHFEILPEPSRLQQQVLADVLRIELPRLPEELVQVLHDQPSRVLPGQKRKLTTPSAWLVLFSQLQNRKTLRLRVPSRPVAPDPALLEDQIQKARFCWSRDDVCNLLLLPGLNRRSYKPQKIHFWCDTIDLWLETGESSTDLQEALLRLSTESLRSSCNKGAQAPQHAFFDIAARVLTVLRQRDTWIRQSGLRFVARLYYRYQRSLRKTLAEQSLSSHGEALRQLAEVLRGASGGRLTHAVGEQFPLALIDEFQDTDPLQVEVFHKLFTRSCCYYIGDPRQAIYGFRGADIHAYLEAAKQCDTRFSLNHNWRSTPQLVDALNALFQRQPQAFLLDNIDAPDVKAALAAETGLKLEADSRSRSHPLKIWSMPEDQRSIPLVMDKLATAVAADISWLLEEAERGRATLFDTNHGSRPLRGNDIAILVHTHSQGKQIADRLRVHGIPCVLRSRQSVLHSAEADDLFRLLHLLLHPTREGLLAGVLCSSLIGLRGDELLLQQKHAELWLHWQQAVPQWQSVFHQQGAAALIENLLYRQGGVTRLPSDGSAERTLVNWQHLAEICAACYKGSHDAAALLSWLQAARDEQSSEEYQLQLESDGQLVQVLTIHFSKGLEFPVVYCPTLCLSRAQRTGLPVVYHDDNHRITASFHLDSEEYHEQLASKSSHEHFAEQLRLCYVALTRARARLVLPLPQAKLRNQTGSVMDWLLFGKRQALLMNTGDDVLNEVQLLADEIPGCALESPNGPAILHETESDPGLITLPYSREAVSASWRITSFSSLSAGLHESEGAKDREPAAIPDELPSASALLPRGAAMGTLLHELLEIVDFHRWQDRDYLKACCERVLQGFPEKDLSAEDLLPLLQLWLTQPLGQGLPALAHLDPQGLHKELEFHLAVGSAQSRRILQLLQDFSWPSGVDVNTIGNLGGGARESFLTGFVDLIFFHEGRWNIVDYKSNYLGTDHAAYQQSRLQHSIEASSYWLQYLIYTLALDRLLRRRIKSYSYDQHMGGAHYLYLRGMNGPPGSGVYHDRVPVELIQRLQQEMSHA